MPAPQDVVVVSALRTPIGKAARGSFKVRAPREVAGSGRPWGCRSLLRRLASSAAAAAAAAAAGGAAAAAAAGAGAGAGPHRVFLGIS